MFSPYLYLRAIIFICALAGTVSYMGIKYHDFCGLLVFSAKFVECYNACAGLRQKAVNFSQVFISVLHEKGFYATVAIIEP